MPQRWRRLRPRSWRRMTTPRRTVFCKSEPAATRPRRPHRSSIRSWGYEGAADGVGGVAGGMRGPGAGGAHRAGGGGGACAVQDAGGGGAALGGLWPEESRQTGSEGEGFAGRATTEDGVRTGVGSGGFGLLLISEGIAEHRPGLWACHRTPFLGACDLSLNCVCVLLLMARSHHWSLSTVPH